MDYREKLLNNQWEGEIDEQHYNAPLQWALLPIVVTTIKSQLMTGLRL